MLVFVLGLTAGVSTCMALVGGLVLGDLRVARGHARPGGRARAVVRASACARTSMFNVGRIVGFGVLGALLGSSAARLSLPPAMMGLLSSPSRSSWHCSGCASPGSSLAWPHGTSPCPSGFEPDRGHRRRGRGGLQRRCARRSLGAATFFLPCGFTQAVQLYALSTATPLTAGLIMATFALGTTPGLLALAAVPEVATGKAPRHGAARRGRRRHLPSPLVNALGRTAPAGLRASDSSVAVRPRSSSSRESQQVSANVTVANGVQIVHMTQEPRRLRARRHRRLRRHAHHAGSSTSTSPYDCSAFLRVPEPRRHRRTWSAGANTVDLPALPEGVTSFTCVMGMYSGTLVAVEPPASHGLLRARTGTKVLADRALSTTLFVFHKVYPWGYEEDSDPRRWHRRNDGRQQAPQGSPGQRVVGDRRRRRRQPPLPARLPVHAVRHVQARAGHQEPAQVPEPRASRSSTARSTRSTPTTTPCCSPTASASPTTT